MNDSVLVEIAIASKKVAEKLAAVQSARSAELTAAIEEEREPFPVETYVELRASTVVELCGFATALSPDAIAQRKACAGLGDSKVNIPAKVAKELIEAAGSNGKLHG